MLCIADSIFPKMEKTGSSLTDFHQSANETFIMKKPVHWPTWFFLGPKSGPHRLGLIAAVNLQARIPACMTVARSLLLKVTSSRSRLCMSV